MQTLGKAGPGVRSFSQRLQPQSPCPGTCHQALPPLPPPLPSPPSLLTRVASAVRCCLEWGGSLLLLFLVFIAALRRSAHPSRNVSPAEALPGSPVKSRDLQVFSWRVGASRAGGGAWQSLFFSGVLWTHVARQVGESLLEGMFSISAAGRSARASAYNYGQSAGASAYNYTLQCYFYYELLLKDTIRGHNRSHLSVWFL